MTKQKILIFWLVFLSIFVSAANQSLFKSFLSLLDVKNECISHVIVPIERRLFLPIPSHLPLIKRNSPYHFLNMISDMEIKRSLAKGQIEGCS